MLKTAAATLWTSLLSSALDVQYVRAGVTSAAFKAVPNSRAWSLESANGMVETFQVCDWIFPVADLLVVPERFGLIQTLNASGVVLATFEINLPEGARERYVTYADHYKVLFRVHSIEVG